MRKNTLRPIMYTSFSPPCQLLTSKRLATIVTIISQNLRNRNRRHVLDIGCGDGTLLANISAEQKVAIDLDTTYVKRIKNANIMFVRADATRLPLKSDTFDLVSATEVLEHLEDPFACVEEIKRVVKKGGYFLASVPNDYLWIFGKIVLLRFSSIEWTLREHKHHDLSKPLISFLGKPIVNRQSPLPLFWFNKILLWLVNK